MTRQSTDAVPPAALDSDAGIKSVGEGVDTTSDDDGGSYSPETLIAWHFWADEKFNSAADTIDFYKKDLPRRRRAFEKEHGKIVVEYFCSNFVGGYIVTESGHVYIVNNETGEDAADVGRLIDEASRLDTEVHDCLPGDGLAAQRKRCGFLLSDAVSTMLGLLDDTASFEDGSERAAARSPDRKSFQLPVSQLEHARSYFQRVAQRTAQLRYFSGVVSGAAIIVLLGVIAAVLIARGTWAESVIPLVTSLAAGAIGGLVSVMSRMASKDLKLDVTVGRTQLVLIGGFRPLVGGIFGCAISSVIAGGLLPFSPPDNASSAAYFFASIGFLAGFSERWAQDMLSESQLFGKAKPAAQSLATSTD